MELAEFLQLNRFSGRSAEMIRVVEEEQEVAADFA